MYALFSNDSARSVAQLRELKPNRNAFALALKKLVYADENEELSLPVYHRVCTRDRVLFVEQISISSRNCHESCIQFYARGNMFHCVSKYFQIPEHLREMWKNLKRALNRRVRRSRKANNDNGIRRTEGFDGENILTDDLFT